MVQPPRYSARPDRCRQRAVAQAASRRSRRSAPSSQPRDRPRLLGDQRRPDQENENARSGGQHEKQPSPHDEDAAAEGEDFPVQRARPGLLPAVEVRLEALAGRDRGELMPASVEGVEHGPGLRGVRDKVGGWARGAHCSVQPARRFVNSPAPRPGTGTPAPR